MRSDDRDTPRTVLPMDDAPITASTPANADSPSVASDAANHAEDADGREGMTADVVDIVPMLREPGHLPGQRREHFSPEQFYAVSRVSRIDVDASDDGLWLTEEPCPRITSDGVQFHSTLYFHPSLDLLVDVGNAAPKRTFVVRYNRALLARGVLTEIVILEKDGRGGYAERCRCRPKREFSQIDFNRLIAARERLKKQLLAKVAHAQGLRITLEHGDRALEELRNEQARQARLQRKARPEPIAATPIMATSQREEAQRAEAEKTAALSGRLQSATRSARSEGARDSSEGSLAERPTGSRRARTAGQRGKQVAGAASAGSPDPVAPKSEVLSPRSGMVDSHLETDDDGSAKAHPPTALADYLGATTGFVTDDDE